MSKGTPRPQTWPAGRVSRQVEDSPRIEVAEPLIIQGFRRRYTPFLTPLNERSTQIADSFLYTPGAARHCSSRSAGMQEAGGNHFRENLIQPAKVEWLH